MGDTAGIEGLNAAELKSSDSTFLTKQLRSTYGSQKGQVEFLLMNVFDYQKNGLKRNGFFVDLACADGVSINNTYFLERHLGWKGILFEPNPLFHSSIAANRSSVLEKKCVTDIDGQTVDFRIDNQMLGGIVGDEFDNNQSIRAEELKTAEIIEIPTTTLLKVLEKQGAPEEIDYLSLDVEGAEELILRNFDFSRYKFRFMSVERPTLALDLILDANDYVQLKHVQFDVFYTHRDYLSEVNFDPDCVFITTPRKDW